MRVNIILFPNLISFPRPFEEESKGMAGSLWSAHCNHTLDQQQERRERVRTWREQNYPDTAAWTWCSCCFLMNWAIISGLPWTQSPTSTCSHHEVEFVGLEVSSAEKGFPCLLPRDNLLKQDRIFPVAFQEISTEEKDRERNQEWHRPVRHSIIGKTV